MSSVIFVAHLLRKISRLTDYSNAAKNIPVHVNFLLGPAGTGKTFRCLEEVRSALAADPNGKPLIFLAPKQATFQLERQLLSRPDPQGYTRLQILSFERLADFVLDHFQKGRPSVLSEEGRMMVLRALLSAKRQELKLFHSTARLPGFAHQLSHVLREFQQCRVTPKQLRDASARADLTPDLRAKLSDFAVLFEAYGQWLEGHALRDSECLLGFADDLLEKALAAARSKRQHANGMPLPAIAGLWLDGFAEMTPQELSLLAGFLPFCERATLAFCLEPDGKEERSWISTWSVVAQTFRQCYHRISEVPEAHIKIETLSRDAVCARFARSPALRHLEAHWSDPVPLSKPSFPQEEIALVRCASPEGEAVFAARELLRFVRRGNRFRDAAVLVRSLDEYHHVLRRVFTRYEIPMFLDRREPVAHHPLAELTRYALRTIAFGWQHTDWFAALKTGLLPAREPEIDQLENQALAGGWQGAFWRQPFPSGGALEKLRAKLVAPFLRLASGLNAPADLLKLIADSSGEFIELRPSGALLAAALERFWSDLNVSDRLEQWSDAQSDRNSPIAQPVHITVWQQMNEWRENLGLAFPAEQLTVREWLPILEAGLSTLTVGVIPPALDQVLIGAVDRSRNPDLKFALVLGMNESVFPAKPAAAVLLTDSDRAELEGTRISLGPNSKQRIGQERYLAYIACTRPQEQLAVTYAAADAAGEPLNPSPFVAHLARLFPWVQTLNEPGVDGPQTWEHESELIAPILRDRLLSSPTAELARFETVPRIEPILAHWQRVQAAHRQQQLTSPQRLYGTELRTSVSALEQFAACPFKFFVHSGLKAKERQQFEVDHRERGSFQHAVLQRFHHQLEAEGKRWRDITAGQARARVGAIGEFLIETFRDGLFKATESGRFTARLLIEQLQNLIATLINWMPQYEFDPFGVELAFGFPGSRLPGWQIELDEGRALILRGLIDRVDLCRRRDGESTEAFAVVIDYKSSSRKLDPVKLQNRLELQLLAYLGLLRSLKEPQLHFGVERLSPAGVFYVVLRPELAAMTCRAELAVPSHRGKPSSFQHSGRFDAGVLGRFDNTGRSQGDQFRYRLKKNGEPYKRGNDALDSASFQSLLDQIEKHLRDIGNEIFAGEVSVAPYRRNRETACQFCEYKPICRFDPWLQPFRVLKARANAETNSYGTGQ